MKQEFIPFVWNGDVTHQLKRYQIPTGASLNGTKIQKRFSQLLDGGICSGIEHQQDQLMHQQMVIDEAGIYNKGFGEFMH